MPVVSHLTLSYSLYYFVLPSNERVSNVMATKSYGGKAVPDLLAGLMARDRPREMQLAAATALTFLHRAGALSADDPKIIYKTLQCLVSYCIIANEMYRNEVNIVNTPI